MDKKSKIFVSVLFAIILAIFSITFFGNIVSKGPEKDLSFYDESYDKISITELNIDAKVNKDNTANITETFYVTFNQSGLSEVIRFIPYCSYIYHVDKNNKVSTTIAHDKLFDISGKGEKGEELNLYIDEEVGFITIGLKEASYFEKGETRKFEIEYSYAFDNDKNKGFDEIYLNIVGTSSTTTTRNISFSIDLPTEIDPAKMAVYYGEFGNDAILDVNVSGNNVNGFVEKLGPGEGITFRAEFEDGFLIRHSAVGAVQIICLMLSVTALLLAVICYAKFSQQKNYPIPVEVNEFEGLTPFSADFYANGACETSSISAGTICLANRGFVTIKSLEKDDFEISKTDKDIEEEQDKGLKALYNALFMGQPNSFKLSEVKLDFAASSSAIRTAEKTKHQSKLYDQNKSRKFKTMKVTSLVLMMLSMVLMFALPLFYFGHLTSLFFFVSIAILILGLYTVVLSYLRDNLFYNIGLVLLYVLYMTFLYVKHGYASFDNYYLCYTAVMLTSVLPFFLGREARYSKEGEKYKGRVLGFKRYIKMCEVKEIKLLAEENPSYYFDVLPYAYVFGLTNVWMDKFKDLEITLPSWYYSDNDTLINLVVFNSFYRSFNRTFTQNVYTKSIERVSNSFGGSRGGSSSGGFGGGFSSGGFSGGGHGGGGFGAR